VSSSIHEDNGDLEAPFLATADILERMRTASDSRTAEREFWELFAPPVDVHVGHFSWNEGRPEVRARLEAMRFDLVQDIVMESVRRVRDSAFEFRGHRQFRSWLRCLTESRLKDRVVRIAREPSHLDGRQGATEPHPGTGVLTRLIREEEIQLVRAALRRLTEPRRRLILLRDFWAHTWSEVCAEVGGTSPDAVRMAHGNAVQVLAVEIQRVRGES
jgi:DNA-directed RNA polymerase specialized sigma24 family protein